MNLLVNLDVDGMADPFGHGFCCVQFLGRGYDAIADVCSCGAP